jgi:MoxR-like ATPase
MLPADIIGVSIFDRDTHKFQFRRGPVFTQLLLADEVNRASPKAQSALLEAMEERQVSVDGVTYPLPEPFYVVATQNPHEQVGTYGLPESQLDRFLMRVSLGYPDRASERRVLLQGERRELLNDTPAVISGAEVLSLQRQVRSVHVANALLDYVQALVARTRLELALGLSPRAAQGLLRAAQAWALIQGESAVLPEHVQTVFPAIAAHRLETRQGDGAAHGSELADALIKAVPVPI